MEKNYFSIFQDFVFVALQTKKVKHIIEIVVLPKRWEVKLQSCESYIKLSALHSGSAQLQIFGVITVDFKR